MRWAAFFNGFQPTALGYFLQGTTKFGGYEVLKQRCIGALRERGGDEAVKRWKLPAMLLSASSAEIVASALLTPLEVLKLRLQTDGAAAAQGAVSTAARIVRNEGIGTLYAGFVPIAMRQVPYTATKLVAYELFVRGASQAARRVERALMPHSSGDVLRPYAIICAGLVAGAAAAVVSHPADLLLTRLCGAPTSALNTNVAECVLAQGFVEQARYLMSLGVRGAYAGLGPRLVMTSAMTSIQFTVYEATRNALGVAGVPPAPSRGDS